MFNVQGQFRFSGFRPQELRGTQAFGWHVRHRVKLKFVSVSMTLVGRKVFMYMSTKLAAECVRICQIPNEGKES